MYCKITLLAGAKLPCLWYLWHSYLLIILILLMVFNQHKAFQGVSMKGFSLLLCVTAFRSLSLSPVTLFSFLTAVHCSYSLVVVFIKYMHYCYYTRTNNCPYLSTDLPHTAFQLCLSLVSMSCMKGSSSSGHLSFSVRPARFTLSYTGCLAPRLFWNS